MNILRKELSRHCRRGSALVIVLASLAFLAALALAFLASVGTELKSSKRYADGVSVQLLAQSTFNMASAQVMQATKGVDDSGNTLAWASQPGMIRTYDDTGAKKTYYRLFSWDKLSGSDDYVPDDVSGWAANKAIFVDLNEPIIFGASRLFPIVDGNSIKALTKNVISPLVTATVPSYWGYDADSDGMPDIDGFSVDPSKVTYAPGTPVSSTNTPVPMPVKWLYVLQDGRILPSATAGLREAKVVGATNDNPIVGRIAFWTDDESCKLNVNTASEGFYWDTPRIKSKGDDALKVNQPTANEYQRYPGHPAMTCLSTVIKRPASWNPGDSIPSFNLVSGYVQFPLFQPAESPLWLDDLWAQKIYKLVPRIEPGGSEGGAKTTAMGVAFTTVVPDSDRLYASVDEFIFAKDRTSNDLKMGYTGLTNPNVLNKLSLERAKFFLTASSRAPDVNLFNKPRVGIWPISQTLSERTPFDKLIAFCSTINKFTYYFVRSDPTSSTADLALGRNRALLSYLRFLGAQSIPGFGGNFSDKYPADKDQIFTEIFDYIRSTNLRDAAFVKIPEAGSTSYTRGVTGSAAGSAWAGLIGTGQVVPIVDGATRGFGRFPTVQGASILFIGQVDGNDPLVLRDPTTHASVPPYPASTSQVDPSSGLPLPIYTGASVTTPSVAPEYIRIQAMFLPQFFTPSVGAPWIRPNFQWSVDLSGLTLNGVSMGFPLETKYNQNKTQLDETGFGDQLGIRAPVQAAHAGSSTQLISGTFDVAKASNFTVGGAAIITIFDSASNKLQTITLNFDGTSCPPPNLAYDHVANKNGTGAGNYDDANIFYVNYRCFSNPNRSANGRYNSANPDAPILPTAFNIATANEGGRIQGLLNTRQAQGFIIPPDAIRSVRLVAGDPRLVAGQKTPPASLFEVNPTADKLLGAHSFFTAYGQPYYGASLGKLVKNLAYSPGAYHTGNEQLATDFPSSVFGYGGYSPAADVPLNGVEAGSALPITAGAPGDWDNASYALRDGPYINKADEGDLGSASGEPYAWKSKAAAPGVLSTSLFSPNRQIPSAVTFGSLPTGVLANRPWQTLLFHPQPGHPGSKAAGMPADHLILDLFHMPVVEPYAISEPLSTAGRINMNYQIVPFTYINRDTGIRALLKSEKVISIKDSQVNVYKETITYSPNIRLEVNQNETLIGFTNRFASNEIFRSATEICELPIVPVDTTSTLATNATMDTSTGYWNNTDSTKGHRLTGDNSRERIYATLYARLTTKSNTYTVYARVQTLKKAKSNTPEIWSEDKDQVTGEYRGYQTIERFIDPANGAIPDYAVTSTVDPLSKFYKLRVISTKQFAP